MANEKRLIDANVFYHEYKFVKKHIVTGDSEFLQGYAAGLLGAYNAIAQIDTVDAVEVVRCKDCNHYLLPQGFCTHDRHDCQTMSVIQYENDFCSYGERRTDV